MGDRVNRYNKKEEKTQSRAIWVNRVEIKGSTNEPKKQRGRTRASKKEKGSPPIQDSLGEGNILKKEQ